MIIDWRDGTNLDKVPTQPHTIVDADTGEQLLYVFFIDTDTATVARYARTRRGTFIMDPSTKRIATVWENRVARFESAVSQDSAIIVPDSP
jgi:hypothetical protein